MIHNDVLRSVRYMLDISDKKVIEIIKTGGMDVSMEDLLTYLDKKEEDEEGFVRCPDDVMAHFLDGLVIFKRGKDESRPPQPIETPVTNNIILKKLRVAFELKEDDMHAILKASEFPVSKPELSALFRKFGHTNYRTCGDQLLRNFLKGLTLRVRPQ
ncbi:MULTISPECIES: DUF1456 family protein [unclassified Pseudomonas]|uniref:DUF1456 family protein n=1 Tax=unclassified Pseudomonas TaxID=196821 RepID=UPI0019149A45|nr:MULTISPECIES: DUF1456 family protein [unclassified Pseudomonas]MBK5551013.1 DUF1456 family protein [Pseudomonas sp. TH03]MEB0228826.1 DUF1456 family protein [Pseudomonas sp. 5S1]MEB0297975.1 DUF1456 family protein [Pseudomonas sp. 10S4]WPX21098.1 DUF1456 family protein [Pseudomonas sp. 10S4]